MVTLVDLDEKFTSEYSKLLDECKFTGYEFRVYSTLRTPIEQAILWRQSRTSEQIKTKVTGLKEAGLTFIAQCIEYVGPQQGRWATDALPGFSWHNWGEAADAFLIGTNNKAIWDSEHAGYKFLADTALQLKLTPGYYFKSRDAVHIQLREKSPQNYYSFEDINKIMSDRFAHLL